MTTTLTIPTIHLNGTAQADLLQQATDAADALRTAREVLREMTPNGRDYYPQAAGAYDRAINEHVARMQRLDAVLGEVEALQLAIADGGAR